MPSTTQVIDNDSTPSTTESSAPLIINNNGNGTTSKADTFLFYARIFAWVFLFVFIFVAAATAITGYIKMHQRVESIRCYECISVEGAILEEPGLPLEKDCAGAPKNKRLCNPGEICSIVKIQAGSIKRTHRACDSGRKLGCVSTTKPAPGTYCYCNSDLCLK